MMKKHFFLLSVLLSWYGLSVSLQARQYDVAAYLYPAYVADDPRLRRFVG